jgi:hypothetical protein
MQKTSRRVSLEAQSIKIKPGSYFILQCHDTMSGCACQGFFGQKPAFEQAGSGSDKALNLCGFGQSFCLCSLADDDPIGYQFSKMGGDFTKCQSGQLPGATPATCILPIAYNTVASGAKGDS